MKYAAPLAIALIVLFPSCATQPPTARGATSAPVEQSDAPASNTGVTPISAYRGAQQAAGAINTVRTIAGLF